jgi:type III secretion protein L
MVIWLSSKNVSAARPVQCGTGARSDVITADEFGALVTLEQGFTALDAERHAMLAAAHEEAAGIIAAAEAQAARILEQASDTFDTAAEAGYRAGNERATADWIERIAAAGDAQAQLQQRMRERLAGVVTAAVEQIVRVEQRDTLFERAVSTVDRIVDGATYLQVAVHPTDHDHAKLTFDRLAARWRDLGQAFPLSVVADKRLEPGSCVCESDIGVVDASLDTQLRGMRSAVSRALKRSVLEAAGQREAAAAAGHESSLENEPTQASPSWQQVA